MMLSSFSGSPPGTTETASRFAAHQHPPISIPDFTLVGASAAAACGCCLPAGRNALPGQLQIPEPSHDYGHTAKDNQKKNDETFFLFLLCQ